MGRCFRQLQTKTINMTFTQHPLSAAFPAMQADEYQALMDSIGIIGVQNPITLFEGMVIDGWNRYRAAMECGMDCPTAELGDVDPTDYVKSQNLHRRHLTGSQRAAAVVACSAWHPSHREKKSVPGTDLMKTDADMAKEAGVSISTVGHAKAAQKAGLLEPVRDGALTAKEAAHVARGVPEKHPAKPAPVVEPEAEEPPDYSELDAAQDALSVISEENDRLNDRLAIAAFEATDEERSAAHNTLIALRAELKTERATNRALVLSRDSLMEENTQMKRQMAMQRKEIDKLKNNK